MADHHQNAADTHDDGHLMNITRDDLFKPFKPSFFVRYIFPALGALFDKPVTLFHDHVVKKIQRAPVPYYHERYARVPDIDSCVVGDKLCLYEANEQFHRDRLVDTNIVRILRQKSDYCVSWYNRDYEDIERFCKPYADDYKEAATNFFIKYGEMFYWADVRHVLYKQKHRMLWEREHGKIGGSEVKKEAEPEDTVSALRRLELGAKMPKELRY